MKYLRKLKGYTQEQLAGLVGIKRSLVGAYEEGRAEPNITNLLKFASVLGAAVEDLISTDLTNSVDISPKDSAGKNLRILSITVDPKEKELIHLVPQKAAAGYLNGYSDPEYISELPLFNIPSLKNGTYRAFEITGDSMLPLVSGTIIVGKYHENWDTLKENTLGVVVTISEGLVFKRIFKDPSDKTKFSLVSDNPAFKPYSIPAEEILEIWEAKGYFSTAFPEPLNC